MIAEELVATPAGFVAAASLCEGDTVYGPDGCAATVQSVRTLDPRHCWMLTFDDGTQAWTDDDSIWMVCDEPSKAPWPVSGGEIRLSVSGGHTQWRFPATAQVHYPPRELAVDPLVFGQEIVAGLVETAEEASPYLYADPRSRRDVVDGMLGGREAVPYSTGLIARMLFISLVRSLGGVVTVESAGFGWRLTPRWTAFRHAVTVSGEQRGAPVEVLLHTNTDQLLCGAGYLPVCGRRVP